METELESLKCETERSVCVCLYVRVGALQSVIGLRREPNTKENEGIRKSTVKGGEVEQRRGGQSI